MNKKMLYRLRLLPQILEKYKRFTISEYYLNSSHLCHIYSSSVFKTNPG